MEGIAGIVYPDVFQVEQLVVPMLNTLRHRGAHPVETETFKNFQLGICGSRLATDEKKTVTVVLDGSLDHIDQLKEELNEPLPPNPSYSQLILAAYKQWGINCIEHLNGEFAFAILDHHKEKIILARDRIGRKPLYWYSNNNYFLFASEMKALLATGLVPQTPATEALAAYLYFGYIPQDMSPIKDVSKLLPGFYLTCMRNRSLSIQSYWSYSSYFERKCTLPENRINRHIDELLQGSVKSRVPPEQPVGCFISGGLGSATVACYLHQVVHDQPIKGFTVGFKGENEIDVKAAVEVAKTLKIAHRSEMITPSNMLDNLVPIAWYLDEPLADPNTLASWKLAELASKEVKTVFSGMGSTELFAGHSGYFMSKKGLNAIQGFTQGALNGFRRALIPFLHYIYPKEAFELLKQSRTNPSQFEFMSSTAVFDEKTMALASPRLAGLFDPEVFLHKFHHLSRIHSDVAAFLYFDVKTRLPDCFMLQIERMTAAHNLDWQTPFLDREIIEFLASLPEPETFAESESAKFLQTYLKNIMPKELLMRRRSYRPNILQSWINEPELISIFKLLKRGVLADTGIVSASWLDHHLQTPERRSNAFRQLWAILMLELWFRLYINHPTQMRPPDVTVRELLSQL